LKLAKRLILIGVISGAAFAVSSLVSIYQSQMAKQVAMQSASELQDGEKALFIAVHAGAVFAQQRVAWKDVLLRSGNAESFKKSWEDFSALDRETNDSLHKLVQYQGRFGLEKADVENAIAQHAQVDAEFRDAYKDMNHGNAAAVPDPVAHHIADLTVKGLDRPTVDAIQLIVDKTYKTVTEQSEADAKKIDSSLSRVIIISLLVALAGIAAVAASLIVNGRAIFKQIGAEPDEVIVLASKIASGNLRVDDYSQGSNAGSVVYAMVRMREGLRDVIAELKTSSATISSSSEGIRNSAESVSVASAKQLDAAREMAAGIEEMSVSITHIEDSADSAKNTALQSHSSASSGSEVIGRMSGEIRHSDEAVREADAKLSNLVKQVTEVVTIVDTVKAIAEQTNLLALNAAIEAERR
jgi:methyl-accepting chemotaxis protein